jgi:hypothetical protein
MGQTSYRFSDHNFEDKKDGHGNDRPIRYKDLTKWYDYVEQFAGIVVRLKTGHLMVNFTTYGFKLWKKSVKDRIEKHSKAAS